MVVEIWIVVVVGLIPYFVDCKHLADGKWTWVVRAILWSVQVTRISRKAYSWSLKVPAVSKLRAVVLAALNTKQK